MFSEEYSGYNNFGKIKIGKFFKRALGGKRGKKFLIGGAIIGAGAIAYKTGLLTKTKDFLMESGIAKDVATATAQQIIAGKEPIPSELEAEFARTGAPMAEAGIFGLTPITLVLILGAGALAVILLTGKRAEPVKVV